MFRSMFRQFYQLQGFQNSLIILQKYVELNYSAEARYGQTDNKFQNLTKAQARLNCTMKFVPILMSPL